MRPRWVRLPRHAFRYCPGGFASSSRSYLKVILPAQKWFSLPMWDLSHWTGRSKRVTCQGCAVARCVLRILAICIGDVSWVVNIPRSPVPVSLELVALYLKPLWACPFWEHQSVHSSHTYPPFLLEYSYRDGDAGERSLIGKDVLTITPFVPFLGSSCLIYCPSLAYQPFDFLRPLIIKVHNLKFYLNHYGLNYRLLWCYHLIDLDRSY